MEPSEYIADLPADRQKLLAALHDTILKNDKNIKPIVKPLMGKDTILYEQRCFMKYGLTNAKNHMSLHCLPMYMNPALHKKYEGLLLSAKFQKGCINFMNAGEMPVKIVAALITECSLVNIAEMLENRKKKKSK